MFGRKKQKAIEEMKRIYEERIENLKQKHAQELIKESNIQDTLKEQIADLEAKLKFHKNLNEKLNQELFELKTKERK